MLNSQENSKNYLIVDRRKFLALAGGLVTAGLMPKSALALAGPYSFKQGAYDVSVVSDGTLKLNIPSVFPGASVDEVKKLIGVAIVGDDVRFEVNVLLLRQGTGIVLIDTGTGAGYQPTAGQLLESLKMAGVEPGAVTKVIYTHAHPDHLWGSVGKDNALTFVNASFHMAENEYNFWAAPDLAGKMPEGMKGMVMGTQGQLAAIKEKTIFFKPGAEILPGLMALDTPGHTPGHVSFEMAGGDGLILTGDAITNAGVFFQHPEWKFGFDADHETAVKSRKSLLDMAATGKKSMLGYHWPYPGIGHAEAKDGAYIYVANT